MKKAGHQTLVKCPKGPMGGTRPTALRRWSGDMKPVARGAHGLLRCQGINAAHRSCSETSPSTTSRTTPPTLSPDFNLTSLVKVHHRHFPGLHPGLDRSGPGALYSTGKDRLWGQTELAKIPATLRTPSSSWRGWGVGWGVGGSF